MPRDGAIIFGDLIGKLSVIRVERAKAVWAVPANSLRNRAGMKGRDGGLMSYGPDPDESLARVAALLDRILKGARPAELPFEQPTRFRFVLNLKTAKSLGLSVPPTLLARADEVIE